VPVVLVQLAAAAWFFWREHLRLPILICILAGVAALTALLLPKLFLWVHHRLFALGAVAGAALARVFLGLAALFLVLPAWAWQRVGGGGAILGNRRQSGWQRARLNEPYHPGGTEPNAKPFTAGTSSRLVVAATVVLGALYLIAPSGLGLVRRLGDFKADSVEVAVVEEQTGPDRVSQEAPFINEDGVAIDGSGNVIEIVGLPVDGYAHEGEPFAPLLFREHKGVRSTPDPVLGSRLNDFAGTHLNIADGRRASYEQSLPSVAVVWFFGGSTMFGIGQRDEHTIPSVVARLAEEDGIRIQPVNFGVSGDNNWIATERFEQAITRDDLPRPNLVVFYDGTNEITGESFLVDIGAANSGAITRLTLSDEERLRRREEVQGRTSLSMEESAARAGSQYRRGVTLARAHGDWFDVPVLHFWQPVAVSRAPSASDDGLFDRIALSRQGAETSRAEYEMLFDHTDVGAIDISDAMDVSDEPIYFDWSHHNELGARLVGDAMYRHIRDRFGLDE